MRKTQSPAGGAALRRAEQRDPRRAPGEQQRRHEKPQPPLPRSHAERKERERKEQAEERVAAERGERAPPRAHDPQQIIDRAERHSREQHRRADHHLIAQRQRELHQWKSRAQKPPRGAASS